MGDGDWWTDGPEWDPGDFDVSRPEVWWGEDEWDAYHEHRNQVEKYERQREEEQRKLDLANKLRQYPPNCGFCGSAFEAERTYGDDDYECVGMPYIYQQGVYECGTEIDSHATWRKQTPKREGGRFSSTDETVIKQWQDRVKGGQTKACRTIMELRWKTDPVGLERDRTDTRTIDEVAPLTAEQLTRKLRTEHRVSEWRKMLAALERTHEWKDAKGTVHQLARMDEGHLRNLLPFLERKARTAHKVAMLDYSSGLQPSGDMATDAFNRGMDELADMDPLEWMRERPLYRAIKNELSARPPLDRRAAGYKFTSSPTPPSVPHG